MSGSTSPPQEASFDGGSIPRVMGLVGENDMHRL